MPLLERPESAKLGAFDELGLVPRREAKIFEASSITHASISLQCKAVTIRSSSDGRPAGLERLCPGRWMADRSYTLFSAGLMMVGGMITDLVMLGCRHRQRPRRTLVPVGRGDVDNATAALSLHDAHFVLHAQDHAENIRVERRGISFRAFRGLVRDRANLAFGASIVHRDIGVSGGSTASTSPPKE